MNTKPVFKSRRPVSQPLANTNQDPKRGKERKKENQTIRKERLLAGLVLETRGWFCLRARGSGNRSCLLFYRKRKRQCFNFSLGSPRGFCLQ